MANELESLLGKEQRSVTKKEGLVTYDENVYLENAKSMKTVMPTTVKRPAPPKAETPGLETVGVGAPAGE